MGRYYSGDIEGKFWFSVQSSHDASFFGGQVCEPTEIEYFFDKEGDNETINEGIHKCLELLGDNKIKLDEFFAKNNSYNDEALSKHLDVKIDKVRGILEWYARLILGEKIKQAVDEKGQCSFTAEL